MNVISKHKRAIRRAMHKPQGMHFKRFTAKLTEINNFIHLFPGSDATKNIPSEELNEILLHVVPRGYVKQSYLQGWEFEMNTYRETCSMFDQMKISEQVYKGQSHSKKILGKMPTVIVMSRK